MIRAGIFALVVLVAACCNTREAVLRSAADFRAQLPFDIRVQGTSMVPVLQDGDRVKVEAKPFEQIEAGDIVVYWPQWSPTPVCHTAVRKVGSGWKVRGADNGMEDPGCVCEGCYIGVATLLRRDGA